MQYENCGCSNSELNQTAVKTRVSTFLCPSDWVSQQNLFTDGRTNYAGNYGSAVFSARFDGLFPSDERFPYVSLAMIRDGLSNTAAMSEWLVTDYQVHDRRRDYYRLKTTIREMDHDEFINECLATTNAERYPQRKKGNSWAIGIFGSSLYDHLMPINSTSCDSDWSVNPQIQSGCCAASDHPGGANALFCDGHVRFMKQTTARNVWRALGTRDGGEVISADSW